MERREFLKIFAGVAAGVAALAATAQAAPLMPQPLNEDAKLPQNPDAQPAVTSDDEVDRLQPEEVRWGRRGWPPRLGPPSLGLAPPPVLGLRRRRYWGCRRRRALPSPLLAPSLPPPLLVSTIP